MTPLRTSLRTRILVTVGALGILLASAVLYSIYVRKRGFIVGITEDTPAGNVRTLLYAEIAYTTKYNSLPPRLSSMGPPPIGKEASQDAANLIDARLASGIKNGYVFHYVPNTQSGSFIITADPIGNDSPSSLHYFADHSGVVRVESGHTATDASQPYHGDN